MLTCCVVLTEVAVFSKDVVLLHVVIREHALQFDLQVFGTY